MNQGTVDNIIHKLLDQLIPRGVDVAKLSKVSGVGETTIRVVKSRKSASADTLIKLLLAHGVSADHLTNMPRSKASKISKNLTEWNKLGATLSEKQLAKIGSLVKTLVSDWKLK